MILFTIPILSMRLISEERSSGTFELLVTCPVSDWGTLLGKYFALLTVGFVIAVLSSVYPMTTRYLGKDHGVAPEWPIVVACYLQLFLIFGTYGALRIDGFIDDRKPDRSVDHNAGWSDSLECRRCRDFPGFTFACGGEGAFSQGTTRRISCRG